MTLRMRSRIEYLITTYKILVILLHSHFTQNLTLLPVLVRFIEIIR